MKKYKWTKDQADWFIETQKENSVSWSDGVHTYYYDWARGKNIVTKDYLHVPNLDHIIPKSLGGTDAPENMRIRCRRVNENRGNTNSNKERRATIIDMFNDIDDKEEQRSLLNYLSKQLT